MRSESRRWVAGTVGLLFVLSLLLFLALLRVPRVDGQLIGSDGVGYYVYLPALLVEGDLDFTRAYAYYGRAFTPPPPTPLGLPGNKYAVGPALLWTPFFLAAHLLALAGRGLGLPVAANGLGNFYQAWVCAGSIVYGALGFALAGRCAARLSTPRAAAAAVALVWLAGNAIYYLVFEPSMSHAVSLFAVALLLTIWLERCWGAPAPALGWCALLGAAGGLVLLVRLQDAPFLLLPAGHGLLRLGQALRAGDRAAARRWLLGGLAAGACALLVFAPQLLVWQRLYGVWTTSPYAEDHNPPFYWLRPQLGGVLFSTYHGLFTWHPVLLGSLAGLLLWARRGGALPLALLGVLALNVYVVAAWWAWWQGDSFGGRMFLSATWIWVLGLAPLLDRLRGRTAWRRAALAAALALLVWNGLSLTQYRLGLVPRSAPLTWRQMTIDRLRLPLDLWRRR